MSDQTKEEKLLRQAMDAMNEWQQHQGYTQFIKVEATFTTLRINLDKYFNDKKTEAAKKPSTLIGF